MWHRLDFRSGARQSMTCLWYPGRHALVAVSAAVRSRRTRRLDDPAAARCHRLSLGGEPRPARADRPQTSTVHGRSAPSSGGESPDTRTARGTGHRHDRDAGHLAGLASHIDRQEIRWEQTSRTRAPAGHGGDPSIDRAHGHRKPQLGLYAHPRGVDQPGSSSRPRHDRQHPPRTRLGAGARACEEDDVDGVPENSLGRPRRGGFLHGRGLDRSRPDAFRRPLPHRTVDAPDRDRRDHVGARRRLDESGESRRHRPQRWLSDGHTLRDPRSGSAFHPGIPRDAHGRRCPRGPRAAPFPESQEHPTTPDSITFSPFSIDATGFLV